MKDSLIKGLLMGLVGVFAAAFTDMQTFNAAYLALVTVLFTAQYLVKNWIMPSVSEKLTVSIADVISGAFAALFMGVSVYAATLLTDVEFTWLALWKAVSVAVAGYFIKTVPASNK